MPGPGPWFAIMRCMRALPFYLNYSLLGIILFSFAACAAGNEYVELKGRQFSVEIADTPDKQALGLMYRDRLPEGHGMLFIFQNDAPRSFWMKNTRIPLDIMYFSSRLELVSMAENARPCRVEQCPAYPSAGPVKYVLELNAGMASQLGMVPGDRIILHLN